MSVEGRTSVSTSARLPRCPRWLVRRFSITSRLCATPTHCFPGRSSRRPSFMPVWRTNQRAPD